MASVEDTIEVPADTYSHALPDDHNEDTVEIRLSSFGDKLYFKFPRFDRRGTNDMCMSAESIFQATVRVTGRGCIEVEPVLRKMKVLREREKNHVHGDPSDVVTTILGSKSDTHPAHLRLVEEFTTTISGFQDDDYWKGYRKGMIHSGDGRYEWTDVAWDVFNEEWTGNKDLLLDVGRWFAREGIAVCSKSKAFFPAPEWTTPTGSYVATISDVYKGTCPECGADKDEHWECYSSSNRTRVPNKYKCTNCGAKRSGITTG